MFDVVTLGSATKDVFLFLDNSSLKPGVNRHFLEIPFDKKIELKDRMDFSGGSATNAAATFASFGKKAAVIAKIGSDEDAEFIVDDLKARKISTEYLIKTSGKTPISNILISSNNDAVILVYRGIEAQLDMSEISLDFDSKWMFFGPLPAGSTNILPKLIDYCNEKNINTVMNPGSTELNLKLKKMAPMLKDIDIISMNDEEARRFVGYSNDIKNAVKLASVVKKMAIITKGDKGSLVADKEYIYSASAFKAKQINFVGAGDAYLSGFVNALMDGKDVGGAITLGSYNASSVVKKYGAKEGIVNDYPEEKEITIRKYKYEDVK